jgi:hypothetical protein
MTGHARSWEEAAEDVEIWRGAGATRVSLHSMGVGLKTPDEHIEFLRKFHDAVR